MKFQNLTFSSANMAVCLPYQVLNIFLMILLSRGMDPNFEKPYVWIILGSFSLIIAIYYKNKYTLNIQLTLAKNKNSFQLDNPLVLWLVLVLFKKTNVKARTLTGCYEYFYENNRICITQINTPDKVDYFKDIVLLLCIMSILVTYFVFISKINILRYGLAVVFSFTYSSIFMGKVLERWCYFKISFKHKDNVRISPLLGPLGTFTANKVLINPQVLKFDQRTAEYIIEHERGHINSFDYITRLTIDICIFILGLLFCYLQIVNPDVSYLALIPMLIIFLLQIPLVIRVELGADDYASTKLGVGACIQAINLLKYDLKIEDKQFVEDVSLTAGLLQMLRIFKGSISFEDRIKHLKSLS